MNDAITRSTEIYTQRSTAIAVFNAATNRALLAFGGDPGSPAGFVDITEDGQATEYLPFEGITRMVRVDVERTADSLDICVHRDSGDDTSMTLQREAQPQGDTPPGTIQGVYRGHVHAYEEAGSIDVTISEEGTLSCRVPGCTVSGELSPKISSNCYDISFRLSGSRRCDTGQSAVLGELIHFGEQIVAVCRTSSGGILYLGTRTEPVSPTAAHAP